LSTLELQYLRLFNFKNYREAEINLHPKINVFVGLNGSGKTNILDAIYYLAYSKSYFNTVEAHNIHHGEQQFSLEGHFERAGTSDQILCTYVKGDRKRLFKNKKEYTRMSEHIGQIPTVIISPADADLITSGSEMRRKFMDGILAQTDPVYLKSLLDYQRLLSQRNALLKYFAANRTFDAEQLGLYNDQMRTPAEYVFQRRTAFVESFNPLFCETYGAIAEGRESVQIKYKSALRKQDWSELMAENESKDRVLQYTSSGIHRDDLSFVMNDHPVKRVGSQGQRKSFVIALKVAQFDFLKASIGVRPLLLLDDIFDKLDATRVASLIQLVHGPKFGQIFITDTHDDRTREAIQSVSSEYAMFKVSPEKLEQI